MNRSIFIAAAILAVFLVITPSAFAQKKTYQVDQIIQVEDSRGRTVLCAQISDRWEPGKLQDGTSDIFLADKDKLRSIKKKIRKLKKKGNSSAKIIKLQKKLKKLKKKLKKERALCLEAAGGGDDPSPTPTPEPAGNFDFNGNLTSAGKAAFAVPSNLTGNITEGRIYYQNNCMGCHGDKRDKTFTFLRTRIAGAPMFFDTTEVPDDALADITAYLNRFSQ